MSSMGPQEIDAVVALRREAWEQEVAQRRLLAPVNDRPVWWRRKLGGSLHAVGVLLVDVGNQLEVGPHPYA